MIGCIGLVIVGVAMMVFAEGAPRSVGTSFVVLGVVALATSAAGLAAERLLGRRPPPSSRVRAGNGRGHGPVRRRTERR